jgi:hypothetical protein
VIPKDQTSICGDFRLLIVEVGVAELWGEENRSSNCLRKFEIIIEVI